MTTCIHYALTIHSAATLQSHVTEDMAPAELYIKRLHISINFYNMESCQTAFPKA